MNSTHKLDAQDAFNNAMDVKRMTPLLNSICDAVGHDDYEAAVAEALTRIDRLRRIETLLRPQPRQAVDQPEF